MASFHPRFQRCRARRALAQFRRAPGPGPPRHDHPALHRHAVLARGDPPAVRSEGPRLVALCGAGKRLDRAARAGGKRAWHAGVSAWAGDPDVNSRSIGIEICNPGHDFGYPDFPSRQIAATITLCRSILTRNIIRPENIAGAFRRGAEPQAGPGREISLEAVWRNPASVSGSMPAPSLDAGAAEAQRHRREGHRAAEDAGRIWLRHRRHRPLRRRHHARSSPPSSAISARRRSTASPTPRHCRPCGSSLIARDSQPQKPEPRKPSRRSQGHLAVSS